MNKSRSHIVVDKTENPLTGWHNKPNEKKIKIQENQIVLRVPIGTECWCKTPQGHIERTINNAPFHWQKVKGNFSVLVRVKGDFSHNHQKAGLMVRQNEYNWIFTGMEYYNQQINCSTSVCQEHTDWSTTPLPEECNNETGAWFCFKRMDDIYECFYSQDGRKWIQTRQGLFTNKKSLLVGVAAACPSGEDLKVTFEDYRLTQRR